MDLSKFEGHTQGPWHTCFYDEWYIYADHKELFPHVAAHPSQCPVDLKLMAAAPDLLEEVKRLREENEMLKANY